MGVTGDEQVVRPFRFGVLTHGRRTPAEWRQLARRAESLGYSTLQVPQHFSLAITPPFVSLAIAAEATEHLRVGTLVLDNHILHPAIVAHEAAWLARLSGERFELGLGAGWLQTDHSVLGGRWPPPGERIDRLAEALDVIRACWAGAPTQHDGTYYRVVGLDNGTVAPDLDIPVLIGGGGRRVLELARRTADIVSIAPTMRSGRIGSESARTATRELVAAKVALVRAAALAAGRGADAVELQIVLTRLLRPGELEATERVARAFGVPVSEVAHIPSALVGTDADLIDELRTRRSTGGFTYFTVGDELMGEFAPIVQELVGR